jgi:hypothetical protein
MNTAAQLSSSLQPYPEPLSMKFNFLVFSNITFTNYQVARGAILLQTRKFYGSAKEVSTPPGFTGVEIKTKAAAGTLSRHLKHRPIQ